MGIENLIAGLGNVGGLLTPLIDLFKAILGLFGGFLGGAGGIGG